MNHPVLLRDRTPVLACPECQAPLTDGTSACAACGAVWPAPATETARMQQLGRALGAQFEVVRLVGRGGFAEVYEVRDTELARRLAVKVLRTDIEWDPDTAARFKHEARAIAQLSHPNTVPIHFVGEGEGLTFYVMPFIEGLTLADILRADGPVDPLLAAGVAVPILDALEHAHRLGIIHRDIKPDNILVDAASGRPLLVDFGISTMRGVERRGAADDVVGTPHYMSPEQALGEPDVDARADVYAMGAVLHQMVTGRPPFEGESSREILAKHVADPVVLPDDQATMPDWLRTVVARALAKRREERFSTAAEMMAALTDHLPRGPRALMTGTHAAPRVGRDDPTVRLGIGARARSLWPRRRLTRYLVVATMLASFSAVGLAVWSVVAARTPRFVMRNALLAPVRVSVNGGLERDLAPGDSLRIRLHRGDSLDARWRLVGPQDSAGGLRGESLGGRIADPDPQGEIRSQLDATGAASGYLMPILTNRTRDVLRVTLRDSAGATLPCDCRVRAGETAPLGYRRAARLRSVEVSDPFGRTLVFESLDARANATTGEVTLSVRGADFEPPTRVPARAVPSATTNRMVTPLPELRFEIPETITDSVPSTPDSSAPKRPARDRDPLSSIFQNR